MFLKIIITLFSLFITKGALFCDCDPRTGKTKEDFELEWESVDYVMEVKITDVLHGKVNDELKRGYIDKDSLILEPPYIGEVKLEAQVLKVYKGKLKSKTIRIFTFEDGGSACQYHYELGETYLFYGYRNEENQLFETTYCNRTAPLSKSAFDLKLINQKK